MAADSLELQLALALQRFSTLQRRAESDRVDARRLLDRSLEQLEASLEELRVTQELLTESRDRMEQLRTALRTQSLKYWQLFDEMPEAYVITQADSSIVQANRAAAELFNVSQRFLVGKTLSVFVCEDRAHFLANTDRAAREGQTTDLAFKLRPRERAPIEVAARVTGDGSGLRWLIRVAAPESAVRHAN